MRIRPILFNTDMVRAILDGRKTATRRIVKQQHLKVLDSQYHKDHPEVPDARLINRLCPPPYETGDVLYVRETWSTKRSSKCVGNKTEKCPYESCENAPGPCLYDEYIYKSTDNLESSDVTWHPSIHMPKEAARIWLKVKDVRAERLSDMKLDDFLSEGVSIRPEAFNDPDNAYMQARIGFLNIWDSTIPKGQQDLYSWAANPWVWVIEFERCEKPEAAGEEKIDGKNKETQIFSEGA